MENVSSVRPTGKFPEKVENLKPGRLVYPVGTFRTELRAQFTRFWLFIPVPGPRQKHLSWPVRKTKWFPSRLHSCTSAQFVFWLPPPNDQRHTGKTVQRSVSYRKHSARKRLWKTSNSCPEPGFGICLVHGQFRSDEIRFGSV